MIPNCRLYNLTFMESRTLQKQIAKEITLLRYIPEHQLYEISITWQSPNQHQARQYLPEIFLYPFAIKQDQQTQSTKVPEISLYSETSLEQGPLANNTLPLGQDSFFSKREQSKYDGFRWFERGKTTRGVLDYDQESKKAIMKESILKRNREVLNYKEASELKKKMRF